MPPAMDVPFQAGRSLIKHLIIHFPLTKTKQNKILKRPPAGASCANLHKGAPNLPQF